MPEQHKGTFIEGIGDEVIYGLGGFLTAMVPIFGSILYWQHQRSQQNIHPQSEDAVNSVRERRQQQQQQQQNQDPPPAYPGRSSAAGQANNHNQQRSNRELTCPICIANAEFAIETNCGHIFCGQCMVTYWRHGNWMGAIRCPVCRQTVTLMLRNFTDEENRFTSQEKEQIVREINRYNRRFSGQPIDWLDYLRDLPTILRHCVRQFFSVGGLLLMFRLRIIVCFVAAVLYFISPLDIIPEAAFGLLGFLDDFFIMLLLAIYVSIIYRRFVATQGPAE